MTCTPATCASQGIYCGAATDGCGNALSCGTCASGSTCTDGACIANCISLTCAKQGITCGGATDGCGNSLSCGTCSSGYACSSTTHTCSPTCTSACTARARQCSGANTYQTCGNYNTDACLEWSASQKCSHNKICSGGSCVKARRASLDDALAGSTASLLASFGNLLEQFKALVSGK